MDDFTKGELSLIDVLLKQYLEGSSPIEMEHLQDKIQYMIDKYREVYHLPTDVKIGDRVELVPNKNGWHIDE